MLNNIHHGDCGPWLRNLPDNSADACITDPPYGIGFDYGAKHDDDPTDYIEWLWPLLVECERIVRPGGAIMAAAVRHAHTKLRRVGPQAVAPVCCSQELRANAQVADAILLRSRRGVVERRRVTVLCRHGQPGFSHGGHNPAGSEETQRFRQRPPVPSAAASGPPCREPVGSRGGTVLDPFVGSGTTAVAAVQTGRSFLAAEKDADVSAPWPTSACSTCC